MAMNFFCGSLFLLLTFSTPAQAAIPAPPHVELKECEYLQNITALREFGILGTFSAEEECVYYYLLEKAYDETKDLRSLRDRPPPEKLVNITVDEVRITHVELAKGSTYQFNIYGQISLIWLDSRLTWDDEAFGTTSLIMNDAHKIWTPVLIDHGICNDVSVCSLDYQTLEILADGTVFAEATFRYASYCSLDYYKYPEEENSCSIYFTAFEQYHNVRFAKMEDKMTKPHRPVVFQESLSRDTEISRVTQDHSAWFITEQTHGIQNLAGIETLQALKVSVKAEKRMATMKMALRLPVTIATLLMLVAPLFGDLRTQAYVKLVILALQTLCFLYLCSIAPPNGFAGAKPKIYRFYESVFALTTVSMLVTVCCMALSRAKRSVPPSHRVFLAAKLVNSTVCCIEPEDSANYQRYLDNNENQQASNELNYTQDWRHIYMAINNLASGVFFTTFLFFLLLDMF